MRYGPHFQRRCVERAKRLVHSQRDGKIYLNDQLLDDLLSHSSKIQIRASITALLVKGRRDHVEYYAYTEGKKRDWLLFVVDGTKDFLITVYNYGDYWAKDAH